MKKLYICKSITDHSNELLNTYLKDISKIPLLKEGEEDSLHDDIIARKQSALDRLVSANLRFVVTIAKKYQNQGLPLMDLISEGNAGIVKASKLFDPDKGVKFLSYATWWIRQSIIEAIITSGRTVRLPSNKIAIMNKIFKATDSYLKEFHYEPSYQELAELTGLSIDNIVDTVSAKTKCLSFDTPFESASEEVGTLYDIVSNGETGIDEEMILTENQMNLQALIETLPLREQTIIKMYYGFGMETMNLDEIGEKFGLTAERVRQVKDDSLNTLKEKINDRRRIFGET